MEVDLDELLPMTFPREEMLAALDSWWQMELEDAVLPGDPVPVPEIMKPQVEIDSHRAVRALLTLQEIVQVEIPETVIKRGGYDDIAEMKEHLIPRIQALFEKKRKKQNA